MYRILRLGDKYIFSAYCMYINNVMYKSYCITLEQ